MRRLWVLILLAAIALLIFVAFNGGVQRCRPTEDLYIDGTITRTDEEEGLLTMTLDNRSVKYDYENILVNADFYDTNDLFLGRFTFSIKNDVDTEEQESYAVWIDEADRIDHVKYEIVCAEFD